MRLMTKILIGVCILCLLVTPVWANPGENFPTPLVGKVTELSTGQRAPFKGVLLSDDAAVSLFTNLKFTEQECQLRLKRELDLSISRFDAQIESLQLRLNIETKRSVDILVIKNDRIEFLEENWSSPTWYESGEFWFAVGIISGIALTAVSAYAVGQAAK